MEEILLPPLDRFEATRISSRNVMYYMSECRVNDSYRILRT